MIVFDVWKSHLQLFEACGALQRKIQKGWFLRQIYWLIVAARV